MKSPTILKPGIASAAVIYLATLLAGFAADSPKTPANCMAEITFQAAAAHQDPFTAVLLDVTFTDPAGSQKTVPAFWDGNQTWKVRYASPVPGVHRYVTKCNQSRDTGLHAVSGQLEVVPYDGRNPLYQHGFLRVASTRRYLEHADSTPFLWLGDTWWKCLSRRLTWEGFQELTADRQAKGFSVVQIVCGPYPDEQPFQPLWENEGGLPYETRDFTVVNPAYFQSADRRIRHLVESGIVPAIVGGWGRGDCDGMAMAGLDGMKRHWRNLVARFGAYPTVWIIGGESQGPLWTELALYVRSIDQLWPRPVTVHPHHSGRSSVTDERALNFDMLQTGHGDMTAGMNAIPKLRTAFERKPPMPVLIGEFAYEGHMQQAFADVQRYVFLASMLNGAAGLTYGAAGIWHAGTDEDSGLQSAPGVYRIYDLTTWREGMHYPGSTQLGYCANLLRQYPWWQFQPHPEWAETNSFAAGIPGELRFIYQPRRGPYNWSGTVVKGIEPGVTYRAAYFDPVRGKRYDAGSFTRIDPEKSSLLRHTAPPLFSDSFSDPALASKWVDHGTPTRRSGGKLTGGKGLLSVAEPVNQRDLTVSVKATSQAEAGIVLRYRDAENYLVALYTPSLKAIYFHDRKGGEWGPQLGHIPVSQIGSNLTLTASVSGEHAVMSLSDGTKTLCTPVVRITHNLAAGSPGLWLYQIGEQQEFSDFKASVMEGPIPPDAILSDTYTAPHLPSPQDWLLILERVR